MPLALKSRMQLRGSDNRRATEMSAAEYFCLIEANHRPSAGGKPKFFAYLCRYGHQGLPLRARFERRRRSSFHT